MPGPIVTGVMRAVALVGGTDSWRYYMRGPMAAALDHVIHGVEPDRTNARERTRARLNMRARKYKTLTHDVWAHEFGVYHG